ncbi:hypothetical protein RF11_15027 [Thelohanellus kitauei]|uniref:Uncharacterized protein n=1 Tax=Thelohanellus kitauei TaxID=669202 RepID=A0A0C2J3Y0_THEKT|nr:hypothetical protein RF11_15027 [Thelohanellus kitauei]
MPDYGINLLIRPDKDLIFSFTDRLVKMLATTDLEAKNSRELSNLNRSLLIRWMWLIFSTAFYGASGKFGWIPRRFDRISISFNHILCITFVPVCRNFYFKLRPILTKIKANILLSGALWC